MTTFDESGWTDDESGEVYDGYAEAALWSSVDYHGIEFDANYDVTDIAVESQNAHMIVIQQWMADNEQAIRDAIDALWDKRPANHPYDLGCIGHDLWLTRNHHGAGFWDRGLSEELGDALTEAAEALGDADPYVGDDGRVYLS